MLLCLPIYILTVFFSHQKDEWHRLCCLRRGTEKSVRVTPHGAAHRRERCQEVPIWTVSLCVSYWDSRSKATEKHSVLALPSRALFRKLSSLPSVKKGILPKGNESCQTTSYQIPSRWNLHLETTLCPEEPRHRTGGTNLGGSRRVCMAAAVQGWGSF